MHCDAWVWLPRVPSYECEGCAQIIDGCVAPNATLKRLLRCLASYQSSRHRLSLPTAPSRRRRTLLHGGS
eukprot:654909-Pyramimonas_sp.AAC.1